jgi:hypothetical protein
MGNKVSHSNPLSSQTIKRKKLIFALNFPLTWGKNLQTKAYDLLFLGAYFICSFTTETN